LQNEEGEKTVAGIAGVVSGGAGVVSGGAGVVSGGAGVVSRLLHNIYEVAVLPGYFIQDIGPDFWGLNGFARYSLSVPSALILVFFIAKTWRAVMEHKSTLFSLATIFGIYLALAWYGTVIGPRLEFRYVTGIYVFCIYAVASCLSAPRINGLLFNKPVMASILIVHTIGVFSLTKFSGSIYLFGSAYPSVFVSGIMLLTLGATVLMLNSNYSKQVLNSV
jgi:hypothetical protein